MKAVESMDQLIHLRVESLGYNRLPCGVERVLHRLDESGMDASDGLPDVIALRGIY